MAMKVLELEGMYGIGFMGSMDSLTKLMKAFEACDIVDVKFHHVPEGVSGYYAVPAERGRAITLKEHNTLTLAEFTEMERIEKERRELAAEFAEADGPPAEEPDGAVGDDGLSCPGAEGKATEEEYQPCDCTEEETCALCDSESAHAEEVEDAACNDGPCCMNGCAICEPEAYAKDADTEMFEEDTSDLGEVGDK